MGRNCTARLAIPVLLLVLLAFVASGCGGPVGYSVSGRVVTVDGTGVAGVVLAFGDQGTVVTDAEGKWIKTGLTGPVTIVPAKEGWIFDPASVTVVGEKNDVTFRAAQLRELRVTVKGHGTVIKELVASAASTTYPNGTTVRLAAVPDPGWRFVRWEGDASGSTNPISIVVNGDKTVTAVFEPVDFGDFGLTLGNYWRWLVTDSFSSDTQYSAYESWLVDGYGIIAGKPSLNILYRYESDWGIDEGLHVGIYRDGVEPNFSYIFESYPRSVGDNTNVLYSLPLEPGRPIFAGLTAIRQETVTVPAGTFMTWYCMKEWYEPGDDSGAVGRTIKREAWISPTVGIVKTRSLTRYDTGGEYTSSKELVEFSHREVGLAKSATLQRTGGSRVTFDEFVFGRRSNR